MKTLQEQISEFSGKLELFQELISEFHACISTWSQELEQDLRHIVRQENIRSNLVLFPRNGNGKQAKIHQQTPAA